MQKLIELILKLLLSQKPQQLPTPQVPQSTQPTKPEPKPEPIKEEVKPMLTTDKFKTLFPNNKIADQVVTELNKLFPKYEINTNKRIAGFLAQCGHESNGFTAMAENLNYSKEALTKVFKKYFTETTAINYARKPQDIANVVYANRMGNGSVETGEGWKYRGRGFIQLTGKNNYTAFAKYIGKGLDETVSYLETVAGACESACWYWSVNGLNGVADAGDVLAMTKKINGGTIGLEDRKAKYEKAVLMLG